MSYKAYNDYELLYLVNNQQDMVAFDILLKKYEKFIYKKINSFFPRSKDIDDYYQEGLLSLYKAIRSFKDSYNKTFMRYFEVILDRCYINIYHKQKREKEQFFLYINECHIEEFYEPSLEDDITNDIKFNNIREQKVYELYFLENKTINYISENLQLNKKQIYNTIYKIKKKLLSEIKL